MTTGSSYIRITIFASGGVIMNTREENYFRDFYRDAEEIENDPERVKSLLLKVKQIIAHNSARLGRILEPVQIFIRMVRNYVNGTYRQIPAGRIMLIIAALAYLVSPFDAIFDFLPGGFIDDAAIMTWLFASLHTEIETFLTWEKAAVEVIE